MKLLFDQNLPPRLVKSLADVYPSSEHVCNLNLDQSSDLEIREFAIEHGFTIVTKDSDFEGLDALLGFPPKVIWIRRGNCSAKEVERILRERSASILSHLDDPQLGTLVLV